MKILVAVKRVVDAKVKVRPLPDHSGPDIKLARMAMNPFDEIAVEEAVELKEAGKASEVVAVSIGGAKSVDVLRTAMAIGADRAIHVVTDDAVEPLAAAKILAQIVEREKPGIVLLGKQAIDDDCGQTGPMLSGLLSARRLCERNRIRGRRAPRRHARNRRRHADRVALDSCRDHGGSPSCRTPLRDASLHGEGPQEAR